MDCAHAVWEDEIDTIEEEYIYLRYGGKEKFEASMKSMYDDSKKATEFIDAPPCLEHLAKTGFPQGSMNDALFDMGVYARQKYPDTWEEKVTEYNHRFMTPGTPLEVKGIIKSICKKEYAYKCKQQPISTFCNKDECKVRKYGIGKLNNAEEETAKPLIDFVLSLGELVKLDLPERENIVVPFLPAQSISLVFAPRGLGKSWFCMELALSVADGRKFLAWDVPRARRVLYIDGEMPTKTLVDRFKALSTAIPSNLDVLPSETLWTEDIPLNLNTPADQRRITIMLDSMVATGRKPELIIFDNLSSLTTGGDENSNSELDNLLRFLVGLRHKGFAILLVHHAGKGGDQRGASRREDLLDTSIKLNVVKGDEAPTGAKFKIEFVKTRGERPNPGELTAELITGHHGGLEWAIDQQVNIPVKATLCIAIRDHQPKTQAELAAIMEITQSTVAGHIKNARECGFLSTEKKLELTEGGKAFADKYQPVY